MREGTEAIYANAMLSRKGLEHLQILVSVGTPRRVTKWAALIQLNLSGNDIVIL